MHVLLLGGTGSIGSPILRELIKRGHDIWAVARSEVSAAKLTDGPRLSGAKTQRELGWRPRHLDPEGEIARLC